MEILTRPKNVPELMFGVFSQKYFFAPYKGQNTEKIFNNSHFSAKFQKYSKSQDPRGTLWEFKRPFTSIKLEVVKINDNML